MARSSDSYKLIEERWRSAQRARREVRRTITALRIVVDALVWFGWGVIVRRNARKRARKDF